MPNLKKTLKQLEELEEFIKKATSVLEPVITRIVLFIIFIFGIINWLIHELHL